MYKQCSRINCSIWLDASPVIPDKRRGLRTGYCAIFISCLLSITHLSVKLAFCHIITQTSKAVGRDRKEQTEERFLPFPLVWLLAAGAMVTLYDVK